MKKLWLLLVLVLSMPVFLTPVSGTYDHVVGGENIFVSSTSALEYSISPSNIYTLVYSEDENQHLPGKDEYTLANGCLYAYDENTDKMTQISAEYVTAYTTTKNEIFYIKENGDIIRSDYLGQNQVKVSKLVGTVRELDYFNGVLSCVVNKADITFVNVENGSLQQATMSDDVVSMYQFADNQIIWRNSDDRPNYYNIATGESRLRLTEGEANEIMAPYIAPTESEFNLVAVNATVTAQMVNDVVFPLTDFQPGESYFNTIDTSVAKCNHPRGATNPVKNCRYYRGHSQCYGFALYAHDRYFHISVSPTTPESWGSGDYYDTDYKFWYNNKNEKLTEEQAVAKCRTFFEDLDVGSYVRYGKDGDDIAPEGVHSIVVAGFGPDGIYAYECNQDWKCGVDYAYYTYEYIVTERYQFIANWVNHDLPSTGTYESTTYHTVECNNCDGYLRQTHTAASTYKFDGTYHWNPCTGCGGAMLKAQHIKIVDVNGSYKCKICGCTILDNSFQSVFVGDEA